MGDGSMVNGAAEAKSTHGRRERRLSPLLIREIGAQDAREAASDDEIKVGELLKMVRGVDSAQHEHYLGQGEA